MVAVFSITDQDVDGLETREAQRRGEDVSFGTYNPLGSPEPAPAPGPMPGPAPLPVGPTPMFPAPGDGALRRGAARGLLFASAGLVVGGLVAGPLGAAAGLVSIGAVRNVLRAKNGWAAPDPETRAEAGKSATMAIFGLGIAGMLGYQAWKRHDDDCGDDDYDDADDRDEDDE